MSASSSILLYIAGFYIQLRFYQSLFPVLKLNKLARQISFLWQGFIVEHKNQQIDYCIELYSSPPTVVQKKIKNRHMRFLHLYEEEKRCIKTFQHISISHFILILTHVMQKLLLEEKAFQIHASGNIINGKAILFTGESTSGKTTAMKLLHQIYRPIADDSIIIRKIKGNYHCFQTLFRERHYIQKSSESYELAKIYFLRKATYFRIQPLENKELVNKYMIKQLWTDTQNASLQIKDLFHFIDHFSQFYTLSFAKDRQKLIRCIIDNSEMSTNPRFRNY